MVMTDAPFFWSCLCDLPELRLRSRNIDLGGSLVGGKAVFLDLRRREIDPEPLPQEIVHLLQHPLAVLPVSNADMT